MKNLFGVGLCFIFVFNVSVAEKLLPEADAYVRMSRPSANGGDSDLHVRSLVKEGTNREAVTYIRFNLAGQKKVEGAVLELTTAVSHKSRWLAGQVEVYGLLDKKDSTAQDWTEDHFSYFLTGDELVKTATGDEERLDRKRIVFLGVFGEGSDQPGQKVDFASAELDEFLNSRIKKGGAATLLICNKRNTNREISFSSREAGPELSPSLEIK